MAQVLDFEVRIFNYLRARIASDIINQNVFVTSSNDSGVIDFPCVAIEQATNMTNRRASDFGERQVMVYIALQIDIYSNAAVNARQQTREIANAVTGFAQDIGFNSDTGFIKTPSADPTIKSRVTGRFSGMFSEDMMKGL